MFDWLKKLWHDPVWSKVIAAGIIAGPVLLGTAISNRSDWLQENAGINRLTVIAALVLLVPANLWWLLRLAKAIKRKRAGQSDKSPSLQNELKETEVEPETPLVSTNRRV